MHIGHMILCTLLFALGVAMPAAIERNGMALLEKRYLVDGESVDSLWDRTSGGDAKFRRLMEELRFLPNSPTLFNAGLSNGCTLSACFVFDIADSMFGKGSITETRDKAIAVAKAGGGVGYYGGYLRPKNAPIRSIHRKACGPVAVLRDYHAISKLITQGGKRELAQMFVLDEEHDDILEFVHCKDEDPQSLGSFNISVSWRGERFRAALAGEGRFADVWRDQCKSAWAHGCPGVFFPDAVNRANPNKHLGLMRAPNPCGETPNRTDEPCNLGSLVLGRYFDRGNRAVDWKLLEEDVWTAIEFLDDILERNEFPHPDIAEAALLTRKLGLGAMGWADLLGMLHIHYDTPEAVALAEKLWSFVEEVAHGCSERMARLKGPYKGYSDRTEAPMRRNETCTSIAPTGSIALITGCKGFSIEPWFAEINTRKTADGMEFLEDVPPWIREQLDGFRPRCAHEILPEWHVRHQAAFQRHTDLGVSKTVNLPESATVEDVASIYKLMFELDCKGGTVYRDGSREEQVLVARGKTKSIYSLPSPDSQTGRRKLSRVRAGKTYEAKVGGGELLLHRERLRGRHPGRGVHRVQGGAHGRRAAGRLGHQHQHRAPERGAAR